MVVSINIRKQIFHVAVLSAIGLFLELLLIRWLDSQIRALSYFKNLPLIASFLGLGIGFAISGNKRNLFSFTILFACALLILASLRPGENIAGPAGPQLNLGLKLATDPIKLWRFYALLAASFAGTVITMVPLGQITGQYMKHIPALQAYTANIMGALFGILFFFLLNSFALGPWVSTAVVLGALLLYLSENRARQAVSAIAVVLTCLHMAVLDHRPGILTVWSPYQKLELMPLPEVYTDTGDVKSPGWLVRAQNYYYQNILDLREQAVRAVWNHSPLIQQAVYAYNYPYRWIKPSRVLVVGAGGGMMLRRRFETAPRK